jgi:hypothetical protein
MYTKKLKENEVRTSDNSSNNVLNPQYKEIFRKLGFSEHSDLANKMNQDLAYILKTLLQAGILNQVSHKFKVRRLLCKHAQEAKELAWGVHTLQAANILTLSNFKFLCQYAENAAKIAKTLIELNVWGIPKKIINDASFKELITILDYSQMKRTQYPEFATAKTSKDIYQAIIRAENTEQFSEHIKIAAFFMAHHELLKKSLYTQEINHFLAEMQPQSLRIKLNKILTKLGGYSFLPPEKKNLTIGVEIEYSNIPCAYESLTEFVMDIIQKGWNHPGDGSVYLIGENSYGGETTTPIIYNNEDLKYAMLNLAFLQTMGATTNFSCGLHVHIGVKNMKTPLLYKTLEIEKKYTPGIYNNYPYTNYQLEFIKQFLIIYKREEVKFAPIERHSNSYAREVTIPNQINNITGFLDLINQVNPSGRYYELNLHAFAKHGTIEVRRFSGSTEEPHIYATIAMIASIAQEAISRTNHIFAAKLNAITQTKITAATARDKLTTHYKYYKDLPLKFIKQWKTERQTELFMLRVKPLHNSQLLMITDEDAAKIREATLRKAKSITNEPEQYNLTHTTLFKNDIRCVCAKDGIEYSVIGLEGNIIKDKILWKDLPNNIPKDLYSLIDNQNLYLPMIMQITSKRGHTPSMNTVYIYLNQNELNYLFYDTKSNHKKGTISNDKRFSGIIKKLHAGESLNLQETNQVLHEVSIQTHALVSHRVEILTVANHLSQLFTDSARKEAQQRQAQTPTNVHDKNKRSAGLFKPALRERPVKKLKSKHTAEPKVLSNTGPS